MKKIFVSFLVTLAATILYAQNINFKWAKHMGGTSSGWGGWGNSIAVDGSGNVYTTGIFETGTIDVDPGAGIYHLSTEAGQAMFVSKLNAAGELVWAKQMSGNQNTLARGHSITVDARGNVFTTGSFYGSGVDFDPGTGVFNLSASTEDMFVSKLDACGNFVRVKQIGGTINDHTVGYSIALDASGNIYTIGYFHGFAVDFDPGPGVFILSAFGAGDIFVSKLDAVGNFIWARQIGGLNNDEGYSIAVDASGNVYTTGTFGRTTDFDPGLGVFNLSSVGEQDIFVSQLDAAGNFVWAKQIGGISDDVSYSIATDALGNVYTTGGFYATADFDPGNRTYNLTSAGEDDIFVHKMSNETIINTYTPILGIEPCTNKITVENAVTFNTGDTVLLIQMKGAVIDSSNTSSFGTITDYKNSGNYEFNYIKSKSGNIIELKNKLTRQYDIPNGKVQLVRVPYYQNINITSTLTCLPWDGTKGGVLVLNVQNTLELNADIDVSGKGFKGGAAYLGEQYQCDIDSFYIISTNGTDGSGKGEGIFLNTRLLNGRGKAANGGGGGNSVNSGGAGGGNGGYGGEGGKEWVGCNANFINGGIGGSYLNYNNSFNKIYLGGGGGSGHMNDSQLPGGGNGGGIAIIMTNYLKSNSNKIKSDGKPPVHIIGLADDGRSGGGAGGTVLINYTNLIDFATLSAKGGDGDNCIAEPDWFHGPGGGGGGGIIWINKSANDPLLTTITSGGIPGTNINIGNNRWDASPGQNGLNLFNLNIPIDTISFRPNIDSVRIRDSATGCNSFDFDGYSYTNTNPINSWQWDFGDGGTANTQNTSHAYSVAGTYTVKLVVTDVYGCNSIKTLNLNTKQGSSSMISHSICQGQNYAGYTTGGTYVDTLIAANGCDSIRTLQLTVLPKPAPDLGADKNLCSGDSVLLYPGQFANYSWQDGSTLSHITVKQSGLYSVMVTDNCGSASDEIMITETNCDIYFPSAFTPNNDGKNDLFKMIGGNNLKDFRLIVYNRWGQKVFETTDYARSWNGNFNGQLHSSATFVWYCEFYKPGNTSKTKMKGTVTLIR